mmetsp:Transcript_20999/g.24240  ORF Transcript_20999/g.24240 Transcript_20999/m.24240 type:complete len:160 (+) Transcript_20999:157-636(+)
MMHLSSQQSYRYGGNDNFINNDINGDVIVTIEEPDDTSDVMLHLEEAVVPLYAATLPTTATTTSAPVYDNHDLFYNHFDYDPLLYFAEYNKNNPIIDNVDNDDKNDIDIIMECSAEAEEVHRIRKGSFEKKDTTTPFHYSLEPISESDEETEEEEEQYI